MAVPRLMPGAETNGPRFRHHHPEGQPPSWPPEERWPITASRQVEGAACAPTCRCRQDHSMQMFAPDARSADPLLRPFSLRGLDLRNRIVSTSHASMLDDGGMPGERYQAY